MQYHMESLVTQILEVSPSDRRGRGRRRDVGHTLPRVEAASYALEARHRATS